jgi:hypothetical protein
LLPRRSFAYGIGAIYEIDVTNSTAATMAMRATIERGREPCRMPSNTEFRLVHPAVPIG